MQQRRLGLWRHGRTDTRAVLLAQGAVFELEKPVYSCDSYWDLDSICLPGDSYGRGSFDTSARFVAGDPGARFGDSAPLECEVTGEIGHPHWELIFEYILRQCGYLVDFHTVCVMVDNPLAGSCSMVA